MAVLAREGILHAAVEEIGDVRVLLRLGHAELRAPRPRQNVAQDARVRARGEEDGVGEVVLVAGHRREVGEGAPRAVEVGEVVRCQGRRELAGPVRAEVEEEDGVVGLDSGCARGHRCGPGARRSPGRWRLPGRRRAPDHRRWQELVGRASLVAARDVLGGAVRPGAGSLDDRPVAELGARPPLVPVHGEVAARNSRDTRVVGRRGACLQLPDPADPRGGGRVAAVRDAVESEGDPGTVRPIQERMQVADLAMDTAVGTEPDKV